MGFTKPVIERHERTQPTSVHWISKELTHRSIRLLGGLRWEMFSQNDITLPPKGTITLELGFGVRMSRGVCLISLRQYIKEKRCSLQDGIVSEDVEDMVIIIQNHSDSEVIINKGESLCYVNYCV